MLIRTLKPHNNSTRHRSCCNFRILTTQKPVRALLSSFQRRYGKNHRGIQTNPHRGGGHKRLYRSINFRNLHFSEVGKVLAFEYDPNRNANLALIHYTNGAKAYVLQAQNLQIGDNIQIGFWPSVRVGNTLPLKNMPLGTQIHNLELHAGKGAQFVRSAGTSAVILGKEGCYVSLKLPSGEIRHFLNHCWATIGQVGNLECNQIQLGKAGRSRWKNKRPHVRGTVMNPVDHPHGGGEGRAPIGRKQPVTPWGKPTLGRRTRSSHKYSDAMILRRRV